MERTAFDDHLARLSRRERTAFVGALLTARGWDVEVDPPVVRATQGDRRRVVAVAREGFLRGYGLPRESVDAVVAVDADRTRRLATGREARAWDARTLYDMARHGLDPAATDRLFREHFGVTSEAVGHPTRPGDAGTGSEGGASSKGNTPPDDDGRGRASPDRSASAAGATPTGRPDRWVAPLVVAAVLVLGGAVAAQALGLAPVDATGDGDDVGPSGSEVAVASPTPRPTATPEPRQILPGLTASGISDTAVLARGHAAVLENRSFTMRITYTERVDGETVGRAREVVRVVNGTVYRSQGSRSGELASDLVPVIVRDLYADGEGRYLRQGNGSLRVGDAGGHGTGQFVERSRALSAWYLSGDNSSLLGQVRHSEGVYYRVAVEGTSDDRFDGYRATGLVSEQGLVVRIDATYRLPDRDRVARVSLWFVNVGNTTVTRPDWLSVREVPAGDTSDAG